MGKIDDLNVMQINVGKIKEDNKDPFKDDNTELSRAIIQTDANIVLIQEPNNKRILNGATYKATDDARASIWVRNDFEALLKPILLDKFSDRDIATVRLNMGKESDIILVSIYMPTNDKNGKRVSNPIEHNEKIEAVTEMCDKRKLRLIIAGDANSKNRRWGGDKEDKRGDWVSQFIDQFDLNVLNKGNSPTFRRANAGKEVITSFIDITLCSRTFTNNVVGWNVKSDICVQDHYAITFRITGNNLVTKDNWVKKEVNYKKMNEIIAEKLKPFKKKSSGKAWGAKTIAELNRKVEIFNGIVIQAYQKSTRKAKIKHIGEAWYDEEMKKYKNEYDEARDKYYREATGKVTAARKTMLIELNEEVKIRRRIYEHRKWEAKKNSMQKFLQSIDSLSATAKLQKIYEGQKSIKIGSLIDKNGKCAESVNEVAKLLIETHSPGAEVSTGYPILTPSISANEEEKGIIDRLVTTAVLKEIWQNMGQYKAPGPDGIFPALLNNTSEHTALPAVHLIRSSLKLGYCPDEWGRSTMTFIPKEAKKDYKDPKSFRPISLTACLKKTTETVLNNYIKREICGNKPFAHNQHAFQTGHSCESALHNSIKVLEDKIGKTFKMNNRTIRGKVLAVFIDYKGAFDNVTYEAVDEALEKANVPEFAKRWAKSSLENRQLSTNIDGNEIKFTPRKGVPQGSVLSPLFFNLIMNGPLELAEKGTGKDGLLEKPVATGFADDLMISMPCDERGMEQAFRVMSKKLEEIKEWGLSRGLEINPEKTNFMIIHQKHTTLKEEITKMKLMFEEKEIERVSSVRYLGVFLDDQLKWNKHMKEMKLKGLRTLVATQKIAGVKFGISPFLTEWIYKQIVLPRMLYANFVWWREGQPRRSELLDPVKNLAGRLISGAIRGTPSVVIQCMLGQADIHDEARQLTKNTISRLEINKQWKGRKGNEATRVKDNHQANQLLVDSSKLPRQPMETNYNRPFYINISKRKWSSKVNTDPGKAHYVLEDPNNKKVGWIISKNKANKIEFEEGDSKASKVAMMIEEIIVSRGNDRGNIDIYSDSVSSLRLIANAKYKNQEKANLWAKIKNEEIKGRQVNLRACDKIEELSFGRKLINEHDRNKATKPLKLESSNSMNKIKKKNREELSDKIKNKWENFMTKEREKNSNTFKTPQENMRPFSLKDTKFILSLNRREIRSLCTAYSGRSLDERVLTEFREDYGECCFCGENNMNKMNHWLKSCEMFEEERGRWMIGCGKENGPRNWHNMLTETKLSKMAHVQWDAAIPEILEALNRLGN
jgi:hypothetical protein